MVIYIMRVSCRIVSKGEIIIMNLRIAELRKEKGVTQDELAKFVGVSYQAVSKWETGLTYPDITLLPKLSEFFGVSIDVIMGNHPLRKEPYEMYDVIKDYLSAVEAETLYDNAWKLTGVIHEGLCSKGWKSFVKWDMSKNRLIDDSYEKWGVSINCEKEGFTHMTKGFTIFGDMNYIDLPKEDDVFKIARLFESFSDRTLLRSLMIVYQTALGEGIDKPMTKQDFIKQNILNETKIDSMLNQMVERGLLKESFSDKNDTVLYTLDKGYILLPLLLIAKLLIKTGIK